MKRILALLAGLVSLTSVAVATAAEPADLSLVVFQLGKPVAGVQVVVDGRLVGETNEDGALQESIPSGRHQLLLRRQGVVLKRVDLLTDSGESVQMLANVPAGGGANSAELDIETSGSGRAVAAEQATEQAPDPGALMGMITSTESGQPIANARVYFAGIEASITTDADGRYQAEIPAGTYQVSVVHPDYATQTLENVRVIPGKQVTANIELSPAGLQLADYTVTAPYVEGSVASVFSEQRDASGVTEVLGAEQMSRAGDSTAADALQRVTGLTIEDGKFVVIRGQPARYTKTLWNGSPLPSPDPIKRIVPLDLFPTGVLSSIAVEKSYDAAYPGSFGAGLINLNTSGAPEEDFAELSVSVGVNTMSTGEVGQTYEGGSRDFLGVDDGTRELPGSLEDVLGSRASDEQLEAGARELENIWALEDKTLPPDVGLGFSAGRTASWLGGELGLRGAFSWGREYRYSERIDRDFALTGDGSLVVRNDQLEKRTDMDVDVGGLFGATLAWEDHSLASNTFLIRKTRQRSQVSEGTRVVSDDLFIRDFLLDWNERELFTQQFLGDHQFEGWQLDWRAMLAESSRESPDRRSYIYERQSNGQFVFFNRSGAQRRFTESDDEISSFGADLTIPVFEGDQLAVDLGTGFDTYTQDRTSEVRRLRLEATSDADLTQDPEELLAPDNIGDTIEVEDDTQTNDSYLGDAGVDALYLKTDIDWGEDWSFSLGLRQERSDFRVRTFQSGGSQGGQQVEGGFERTDTLPSLSATWRFHDDMQLRASFGRTISRPVLNELSPARYFDPDSDEEFLGNPDLLPAEIDSLDVRWEWYPSPRETVSLGMFTKEYTNPIEESFVGVGGSSFLRQVQNADSASVSGFEAAARTDLTRVTRPMGWAPSWSRDVYVQGNVAFIDSEVTLAQQDLATSAARPLQGQADSVLNAQIGYNGERHDATLSFNRVGERLRVAGVQGQPDVFQEPVTQLDFNYTYRWSKALQLEASASNLLDQEIELLQGGEVYSAYSPGVDFGFSLKYRF